MTLTRVTQVRNSLLHAIRMGYREGNERLPTISDLAEGFGVSIDTVQKAVDSLKESGLIDARRGKGLFVNALGLRPGMGTRIGLIHPAAQPAYLEGRPWPAITVDILREKLGKAGYELIPCSLADVNLLNFTGTLMERGFAALALFEVHSEHLIWKLLELALPTVSLDFDAYRLGISSVVFDSIAGTFDITKHLIDHGHTEITFVRTGFLQRIGSFVFLDAETDQRLQGYRLAMHEAGLPERVEEFDMDSPGFAERLHGLLNQGTMPTALCLPNSHQATVFARTMERLGFGIPEDISITGVGQTGDPYSGQRRLTTVNLDMRGMGEAGARLLLAALSGVRARPQRITLPGALEIGDSVRKPSANARDNLPKTSAARG